MKRFTATWTMAIASAVLLTVPATGSAQTAQPATPATASAPQSDATSPQAAAQEHLRKASAALAEIKTATLPAAAKNDVTEIKRRVAALERTTSAGAKASATGKANAKAAANWGTEVAAIDKALTTLLGPATATSTSGTAGAAGTAGTSGATSAGNKAAAAITLDAEARASLTEVRTHLTAFATAMAGGKTSSDTTSSSASADPAATNPTSATGSTGSTSGTAASGSTSATSSSATAAQPPTSPTQTAQPPATGATAAPATGNEEEARRHLTEARNTLSALTQLPAAAQLSGDARTQVAQLISNFNELITAQSQWRDAYTKVSANLTALIGPDPVASDPTNASGTSGAVGTSGTSTTAPATIDPAIREKLVELRRNLTSFEKAAGGGAAAGASSAATGTSATGTTPTDPAAATKPAATGAPASSSSAAATGTTPTTEPAQTAGTTGTASSAAAPTQADLMKHVAAIEAMLKMQDDSGGLTLTKAQVEQLRTHWAALRAAIEKK